MEYSVIKEGDLFFLTDKNGELTENNENGYGLYTKDTRFLSRMELFVDGEKPSLLSSSANRSYFASIRLMKDRKDEGAIEIHRERFIYDGVLYERVSLTNFFPQAVSFNFSLPSTPIFRICSLSGSTEQGKSGRSSERSRVSGPYRSVTKARMTC